MINGKMIVVVMPAYNAATTLERTLAEIPYDIADQVVLVDDASQDNTVATARELGISNVVEHDVNLGYGGNQKTCYRIALKLGADIVIMVHPDYQYSPRLIRAMTSLIADDVFDCVLGSRILGIGALQGGMPKHKYVANRLLTLIQNLMVGHKLSEFHTGYRAFSRQLLEGLELNGLSDTFIFDNQMLLHIIAKKFRIGEVSCPTRYTADSSSIGGWPLIRYGLGVLVESMKFLASRLGLSNAYR